MIKVHGCFSETSRTQGEGPPGPSWVPTLGFATLPQKDALCDTPFLSFRVAKVFLSLSFLLILKILNLQKNCKSTQRIPTSHRFRNCSHLTTFQSISLSSHQFPFLHLWLNLLKVAETMTISPKYFDVHVLKTRTCSYLTTYNHHTQEF